jgi:hypothetical protein
MREGIGGILEDYTHLKPNKRGSLRTHESILHLPVASEAFLDHPYHGCVPCCDLI